MNYKCFLLRSASLGDRLRVGWLAIMFLRGFTRREDVFSGTDPKSYITEYTLVYEEKHDRLPALLHSDPARLHSPKPS
jgi:hypothetical protein